MPTYEYECKKCGHNFEVFQSMSDEPIKHCEKCGKEVRRLILGGAGVIFKGSGFYVTDKGNSASKSAGKSADADKSKKSEGKTEGETKTAETAQGSSASPPGGDTKKPAGDGAVSKESASSRDGSQSKSAAESRAKPSAQSA